jgi:hypothetical protein
MKKHAFLLAGLLLGCYACFKPKEVPEPITTPANIVIEATVPAKVWDNVSTIYLDATRTNTLNGRRELSYRWSMKNAPAGASVNMLQDKERERARLDSPLVVGSYEIELLVSDRNDPVSQARASYKLEILADTLYLYPPRANAGDDRVITSPESMATLDGLRTYYQNPIGRSQTFTWSVIAQPPSSPAVTIVSPSRLITDVFQLVEGNYLFQLKVINERKLTALDTVQVTVLPDPLKGTVKLFSDLIWEKEVIEDWGWGPSTQVVLYLHDPSLSVKRIPGNTDVRVWIDSTKTWTPPNEYTWSIVSDGVMQVVYPYSDDDNLHLKDVGKKTKVEIRFK